MERFVSTEAIRGSKKIELKVIVSVFILKDTVIHALVHALLAKYYI